jgi:hypothetical protein
MYSNFLRYTQISFLVALAKALFVALAISWLGILRFVGEEISDRVAECTRPKS